MLQPLAPRSLLQIKSNVSDIGMSPDTSGQVRLRLQIKSRASGGKFEKTKEENTSKIISCTGGNL